MFKMLKDEEKKPKMAALAEIMEFLGEMGKSKLKGKKPQAVSVSVESVGKPEMAAMEMPEGKMEDEEESLDEETIKKLLEKLG